jgi:RHS repeat-associated protein
MRRNTTASSLVPLFPQANWRGLYETGTKDDGSVVTNSINWPGASASAYLGATPPSSPYEWFGSLIAEQADASGLMYRRNRYYDPQKGRFTTPDPIGVGGGFNAYGFAGGDPVSYSDPFGLCPDPKDPRCTQGQWVVTFTVGGFVGLGKSGVSDKGLGLGGTLGVGIDNHGNMMAFAAGGLGVAAGHGTTAQLGYAKGSLNDLVARSRDGGGATVTAVAPGVGLTAQLNDEGHLTGIAVGPGSGLGVAFQTTQQAAGTATTSVRAIQGAITQKIESLSAELEPIKRQAVDAITMRPQ